MLCQIVKFLCFPPLLPLLVQALATTAGLASIHRSKVMVLVVDQPGEKSTDVRFEALSK